MNSEVEILLKPARFRLNRFDPTKLVLRANILGADGIEIERELITAGVRSGDGRSRYCRLLLATLADDADTFAQLAATLIPILHKYSGPVRKSGAALSWSITPQIGVSMREAYFAHSELVDARDAIGRIGS